MKILDIEQIVSCLFKAGEEWTVAKTIHHRFQIGEKEKLARIKQELRKDSPPNGKRMWTRDDLEEFAYASKEWKKFLDDYNKATEAMLKAKNNMDAWQNQFEAKRSVMATERTVTRAS